MRRLGLALGVYLVCGQAAVAQHWAPWSQDHTYEGQKRRDSERRAAAARAANPAPPSAQGRGRAVGAGTPFGLEPPRGPALLDGGPRPSISPAPPSVVSVRTGQNPGTILIDQDARRLYLTQTSTTALVYPISVGRDGFQWTGTERISRVADWPDWHPPAEMRQRQPELPEKMTGGLNNPLGAKALYLGNSLYRIHGSNTKSVGSASSSGCFRMNNAHVIDLAARVGVGTTVVVKNRL